jgi:Beta-lactamase enzyme family
VLVSSSGIGEAQRFAAARTGEVAFAVMTEDGQIRGFNASAQFRSASVTKAMLMVAVLRRARARPVSAHEKALLKPMITASDNEAADTVYAAVGDLGLQAVAHAAHMRNFLGVGALFESRITAADQVRLFLQIDRLVPKRHRAYARQLLSGIIAPHRWGIVPVAQARHFQVFFKGGWREDIEHQVALLERFGRRIALAVLTSGESSTTGRATEAGIASRVLAD